MCALDRPFSVNGGPQVFYGEAVNNLRELRWLVYKNIAAKVVPLKQISKSIDKQKWDNKEILSQHNTFVRVENCTILFQLTNRCSATYPASYRLLAVGNSYILAWPHCPNATRRYVDDLVKGLQIFSQRMEVGANRQRSVFSSWLLAAVLTV
jgi:hypothetical protein